MLKILDCTLRDGGYYTNWDFDSDIVNTYIQEFNNLPVDYLEVGYRSKPINGYFGKYFYCPVYELQRLRQLSNKKLVVILNEKDVRPSDVDELLTPCIGLVDMVRIALDPQQLRRAISLAEKIKTLGFEVGFNVMYMSKWAQYSGFVDQLKGLEATADYFYMVDSYGGVMPDDVKRTMDLVRSKTDCRLGFHGHNNLELALINSLTAIEYGADIVDSTVLGMGRGAGNLKTELLLTVLNSKYSEDVDFNALGKVVDGFDPLLKKHQWGTNVPYMISGSNSLPQKDVMDWVTTRFYSFNSIIQALQNKKDNVKDNNQFPLFKPTSKFRNVLIIGGGPSAAEHSQAISEFVQDSDDICIIHASSKNALFYKELPVMQYHCLLGSEGHRLENVFNDLGDFTGKCILPPFPRKMGTYVPKSVFDKCFDLEKIDFAECSTYSHSSLALQTAKELGASTVFLLGFDGYTDGPLNEVERKLVAENEHFFAAFQANQGVPLISFTPTKYQSLTISSIYTFV